MENFHDIDLKEVGNRIRAARKAVKFTQAQAAEKCFITPQYWSLVETGNERASIGTYRQIAGLFGLTLDDLFYDGADAMRIRRGFTEEGMLADCTDNEKVILSEAFFALKEILQRNRPQAK